MILKLGETQGTKEKMRKVLLEFSEDVIFDRNDIMYILGITKSPASVLLQKMKKSGLIVPIKGYGKGKYHINSSKKQHQTDI